MAIDGEVARIQRLAEIMTLHGQGLSAGLIMLISRHSDQALSVIIFSATCVLAVLGHSLVGRK
jgi:hypothetical protein